MSEKILNNIKPGVATGNDVQEIFRIAKENEFAIPAVNVVGTDSVNAVMESAKDVNSPVVIQFSNGGASFYAGKGLSNDDEKAATAGLYPVQYMFISSLLCREYLLYSILIMQPENYSFGLTNF